MNNKELLKIKLAAAARNSNSAYTPELRDDLQSILRHGAERDIALIKEAMRKRTLRDAFKSYFKQTETIGKDGMGTGKFNSSKFQRDSGQAKDLLGLAGAIGGGAVVGGKAIKKLQEAIKLKRMSPMKRALHKGFGKDTLGRKALLFGGGAAGISLGIKGAEGLSDSIVKPIKKRSAFNKMMDDNPSLKKESPKDVKRVFNTLFRFNPKMAADPLVAGSFMKRTLQFKDEGIQPVDVKTLTEVGRNMSMGKKPGGSILSAAFLSGANDLARFAG